MDAATRALVRQRAGDCCEYCGRHQDDSPLARLQIEHIIPRKHGGSDDLDNLCLACIDCNLGKSSNLTGIDPQTGDTSNPIPLFNPRTQVWIEHFERRFDFIVGQTDVGRTTVSVLNMNDEEQVERRRQSRRQQNRATSRIKSPGARPAIRPRSVYKLRNVKPNASTPQSPRLEELFTH